LNGSVFDRPVAAFRVIPYFARKSLPLPDLDEFLDISTARLRQMEQSSDEEFDDDKQSELDMRDGDDDGPDSASVAASDND
jgi:hypothetical protein